MTESFTRLFSNETAGGVFVTPPSVFIERLSRIKAVLFDWDGVFNEGFKQGNEGSSFSEVDAMGTNLLRYALWRKNGRLPVAAVITGENNPAAVHLSKRESFHQVYLQSKNKSAVFENFLKQYYLAPVEVAFFFDDVLDLEVATQCGLRIMISRKGTPMLKDLVISSGWADYLTGCDGAQHGLREGCELLIGSLGMFRHVVENRMGWTENYQQYLSERKLVETAVSDGKS